MKRKLAIILIVAMLISIFTALPASAAEDEKLASALPASAAEDEELASALPASAADDDELASVGTTSGDFEYILRRYAGGTMYAIITDCYATGAVTIPETINDYDVRGIEWSDNERSFTSVAFPEHNYTITGKFNSPNLTSVTFSNAACNFIGNIFGNCPKLTNVSLSGYHNNNGVIWRYNDTDIEVYACLGGTTGSVSVPDNTSLICEQAFDGCHKLTSANLPSKVSAISDDAFINCENLKEYTVFDKNSWIGEHAFGYLKKNDEYEKLDGVIIKGYQGSSAETYAKENGFTFKELTAEAPVVTKLEAVDNGVRLNWKAVEGFSRYAVFYQNGNSWKRLATVSGTSYIDSSVKKNTRRVYTVRSADDSGNLVGKYNTTGWAISYYAAPSISLITNARDTDGAAVFVKYMDLYDEYSLGETVQYILYRYANGKWEEVPVSDLSETNYQIYIDNKVQSGKSYRYKARLKDSETGYFVSPEGKTQTVTYQSAPKFTKIENVVNGTKLTWSKFSGAAKYRIFYKNDYMDTASGWKTLATVSGTAYTDKAVENVTYKKYTIRAMDSKGNYISGYVNSFQFDDSPNGWSQLYYPAVGVSKLQNTQNGVKLTIDYPYGQFPASILIYRKTKGSSYQIIGESKGSSIADDIVTYLDRTAVAGVTYTYAVRAKADWITDRYVPHGAFVGVKSIKAGQVQYPAITKFAPQKNGVAISWNSYPKAAKYAVFTKVSSKWKKLATVSGTTYTDTAIHQAAAATAKGTASYIYTVRAMDKSGKYISSYNTSGTKFTYMVPPTISSLTNVKNGVKLDWKAGARPYRYRLYRRTGSESWKQIAVIHGDINSYTDKTAQTGKTYTYTLRTEYNCGFQNPNGNGYINGVLTGYYGGKSIKR